MKQPCAERLNKFETGIFASLNAERDRLTREGKKLYNLFIGTPDFTPPAHVISALTEAAADKSVYETLIEYSKRYDFIIINDNAYSDIIFDGRQGFSFLSIPSAAEVGAEFFSLSKSFNVTGARISFLIGRTDIINALKKLRSQYDFGMFTPIQKAAVAALKGPRDEVLAQCREYQRRRDALCGTLRSFGWNIPDSDGTMFVWAPLPEGYNDSSEFCKLLVRETGVLATPGVAFGPRGEGYIRFALVLPPEQLCEIGRIIGESSILKKEK